MKVPALLLATALAFPPAGQAQIVVRGFGPGDTLVGPPVTPTDYLKLIYQNSQRLYKIATDDHKIRDDSVYRAVSTILKTLARSYVARFAIDTVPVTELESLADLFNRADQRDSAARSMRRYVAEVKGDTARANGLLTLMQYVEADDLPSVIAQLDALGPKMASLRIRARSQVAWRSGISLVIQRRMIVEARALLGEVDSSQRKTYAWAIGNMYETVISQARNEGQTAVADTLIQEGLEALKPYGDTPTRAIRQLSLVGKKAPALEATHWLNAPKGQTSYDPSGKLTLLMITAHW